MAGLLDPSNPALGDGSVLSAYQPTMRERATDWLRQTLFTDDRAGQRQAERLNNVAETMLTPYGIANQFYDMGRAGGQGDYAEASLLGAMAVVPGAAEKLGKGVTPTFEEFSQMVKRGKMHTALDDKASVNAVLRGKKPATDLDMDSGHPLSGQYQMGNLTDRFKKAGLYVDDDMMGRVFVGKDKATVDLLKNAKNPTDYGRAYGYSDDDIAHFYTKRAGGMPEIGYQEWLADNYPEMAKTSKAKAKKITAAAQKDHDDMWAYVDSLDKMSPEQINKILGRGKK